MKNTIALTDILVSSSAFAIGETYTICNNHSANVFVANTYVDVPVPCGRRDPNPNCGKQTWVTKGWRNIASGACSTFISNGWPTWWYATSGSNIWQGQEGQIDYRFCINPVNVFTKEPAISPDVTFLPGSCYQDDGEKLVRMRRVEPGTNVTINPR